LTDATPFIDFHFDKSAADYNVRLINSSSGVLQLMGQMDATAGFTSRSGINGTTDINVPEFLLELRWKHRTEWVCWCNQFGAHYVQRRQMRI
jgi:hypothetical protein